jgi:hypothetical protein
MKPTRCHPLLLMFIPTLLAGQGVPTGESMERSVAALTKVTFQTNPAGLTVIVDGVSQVTPYSTNWNTGTSHTINTRSPQSGGSTTQYVFSSWSDGGAQSHTVNTPSTATTYTVTFVTQYYLTMTASPSGGGTVTPASGWNNKGQSVTINATANSGYNFGSWSGSGTGSYSGTSKSPTITMNGPITEAAQFTVIQSVLSVTPADRSVTSTAGFTSFAVTNVGAGSMNWTASSNQSWATITDGASGTNNGAVTVTYTANPSSVDTRMATITVTAAGAIGSPQTVTLTQSPASVGSFKTDTTSLSDDFYGNALDATLWTFVNPLGDAALTVGNNEFSFVVPGGIQHQPWTLGNTAPRVMQNVDSGANVNVWTVRFNSVPAGSVSNIPMQGMLFEQDTSNYVRIDIFSDGSGVYAFAAGFTNGPSNPTVYFRLPIPVISPPIWIRVTRSGTLWKLFCSVDGSTTAFAQSFDRLLAVNKVGLFAGNAGTLPLSYTSRVDYFEGALPAKPYLAKPDSGVSDVVRPVIFAWDSSTAAISYRLQVAKTPNFAAVLVDSVIIGTSATVSTLEQSTQYWWRVKGGNNVGWGKFSEAHPFSISTTAVGEGSKLPERFALEQNFPNPFNPRTGVRFQVAGVSDVKITVHDVLGREVAVLVNEKKQPGTYEAQFDASGLATGVYIYRLKAGSFVQSRTMLLLK